MQTQKYGMMYDNDIVKYIHDITNSASSLKKEIFKTTIMKKELDKNVCNVFLTTTNEFLRFWDEFSKDLQEKMKSTSGSTEVRTIDYQYVKEFIYAKYDYASVLPFADGIIKGVNSEKFKTPEDITDFMNHTISKAFSNQAESSAEMLDSVLVTSGGLGSIGGISSVSAIDVKMFESIRNYDMFDRRSRSELYKAISEIIKFMTIDIGIGKHIQTDNIKMFVSIINNIMDYITYSLTAYATRIYIISAYAYPFIEHNNKIDIKSISESVLYEDASSDAESGSLDVRVFMDADERICRDPAKTKEFIGTFDPFLKLVGADTLFGTDKPTYRDRWKGLSNINTTLFCSKLTVNPLYEFLTSKRQDLFMFDENSDSSIIELQQILRSFLYNPNQGIQGASTPKQEILHIIRGTSGDGTLKGYQNLAKDLYLCTIHMCCNTESLINDIIRWKSSERQIPKYNTSALNSSAESLKILSEFYRDIASAFMQKARDIELNVNNLRNDNVNKAIAGISINIPNHKSDISSSDNLMTAVPDTTVMPTELLDLYDVPSLESMEMYNDYIRSLPIMESNEYLSEALNISSIVEAIITRIKSAWKKFDAFWRNKSVQVAIKWITDHESVLTSMDYSGGSIEKILPYKRNIELPKGFDNLANGLGNFNLEKVKTQEGLDTFIKSLYPNPTVANWFIGDENKDGKSGTAKYKNYILFNDLEKATATIPNPIQLSGNQIRTEVVEWIKTVKSIKTTLDGFASLSQAVENGIKNIKPKLVNTSTVTPTTTGTDTPNKLPEPEKSTTSPSSVSDNQAKQDTSIKTDTNDNKSVANPTDRTITEIGIVTDRVLNSLSPIFIEYIQTIYRYLQEAHTVGRK